MIQSQEANQKDYRCEKTKFEQPVESFFKKCG